MPPLSVPAVAARQDLQRRSGRVLVVAPQPFYENRGTPIATVHVLRALTQLGYQVDLLTYPVGATPDIPGVTYIRVPNPLGFRRVPVSFSWRKTALDALIAGKLYGVLKRNRYKFIHAVEESAFLVAAARRFHKTPILYDMQSSLPEQLVLKWYFDNRHLCRLFDACERWLLNRVDLVVASAGLRRVAERQAPRTPVREWLFPAPPIIAAGGAVEAQKQALRITKKQQAVVYTGNFSEYQGIPLLLKSIPLVLRSCPSAVFVLVGAEHEAERRAILDAVPATISSHLRVVLKVPNDEIGRYLALADVLVSPRSAGSNLPVKVFEYLASGRPIVATDIPAHRAILTDDTAVLVGAEEQSLARGIVQCLTDRELAAQRGDMGRRYSEEQLSWEAFVRFIERTVPDVAADGPEAVRSA